MTVKVVPLPARVGLKFDLILDTGHVVTLETDCPPEVRISEQIRQKVLDYLREYDYPTKDLHIIFC